jgi:hypothetical protein
MKPTVLYSGPLKNNLTLLIQFDIHFNIEASSLLGNYAMSTSKYQCSEDTKIPIKLPT